MQQSIVARSRTLSAIALSASLALIAATPCCAASPGEPKFRLPPNLQHTGPVAGPVPASLAAGGGRAVLPHRPVPQADAPPVETPVSRQQVQFLTDHRNLYRGPGSLFYMLSKTQPIPGREAAPPAPGPTVVAERAHLQ